MLLEPLTVVLKDANSLQDLGQFRADYIVTSIGAIDSDGTLLDYNYTEVVMAQMMMKNAKHAIIACDKSKFDAMAPVKLGSLANVASLVTDKMPNGNIIDVLNANNVNLVVAK